MFARRRRERLEKEAKDIRSVMDMRATELKARAAQLEAAAAKVDVLGDNLKVQKTRTCRMVCVLEHGTMPPMEHAHHLAWMRRCPAQTRDLDLAKERLLKSESEVKEQISLNQAKTAENQMRATELRKADADIAALYQEVSRATQLKDAQLKRLKVPLR